MVRIARNLTTWDQRPQVLGQERCAEGMCQPYAVVAHEHSRLVGWIICRECGTVWKPTP